MPAIIPSTTNITVRYAEASGSGSNGSRESLQLMEIPPELLKEIEKGQDEDVPLRMTMKGRPTDDAVICTPNKTFQLRTITVSNSLLVLSAPLSSSSSQDSSTNKRKHEHTLEVVDTCHEILEMLPIVPRLERIVKILRESAWAGLDSESSGGGGMDVDDVEEGSSRKRIKTSSPQIKRYTLPQLQSLVQASDTQLLQGLHERNVISIPSKTKPSSPETDKLMLLPSIHLLPLLSIILSLLTIHQTKNTSTVMDKDKDKGKGKAKEYVQAPVKPILESLVAEHRLEEHFGKSVLKLFGELRDQEGEIVWVCDVERVVKEVGKGCLARLKNQPTPSDTFLSTWIEEIGSAHSHHASLTLLSGEHHLSPAPTSSLISSQILTPFPLASLPSDAANRFTELFLTKAKWRPEEMGPFLKGLTVEGDQKALDKLIVKYVRVVKEPAGSGKGGAAGGTWWHPRRTG